MKWFGDHTFTQVEPDKLKAGDIIAYHRTACHSEGFRVLILSNTLEPNKINNNMKRVLKTVVLFSPVRKDFKVGQNYNFSARDMMVTKWRNPSSLDSLTLTVTIICDKKYLAKSRCQSSLFTNSSSNVFILSEFINR